jgi:hypothetical protein
MRKAVNQKYEVYCSVVLCSVVVALYMATIRVYLHDVSLMLVRVEGAHGGEGGAPGQHTWHTQCPFLINRNIIQPNRVVRLYSLIVCIRSVAKYAPVLHSSLSTLTRSRRS